MFLWFSYRFKVDKQLEITWNDDHVSRYDFNWLFERNFTAANRQRYLTNEYRPPMDLWSKDQFVLEQFEFADVLESDEGEIDFCAYFFESR